MAVKYLAGDRLIGTAAERTAMSITDTLGSSADGTNNGTATNSATAIYGKESLGFNGTDATINLGTALDPVLDGAFTFTCWANCTNDSTNKAIICKQHLSTWTSPLYHDFTVQHSNSDLEIKTNDGSTYYQMTVDTGDAGWHFISVTKTSGDVWVAQVDNNLSDTMTHSTDWGSQDLTVGRIPSLAGTFWDSQIQDMAFWSRVLTSSELTTLFGGEDPYDNSIATASDNTGKVATEAGISELKAYYTFDGTATGIDNSAVNVYPNLPNGTIFITSDTNVHYMWNGTDTWNEVA